LVLQDIQSGADLFMASSPLQLSAAEKGAVLRTLDGDIYTVTRIRLPLLLRLDSMLADGGATYDHRIVSVEHVLPQNPPAASRWVAEFPNEYIHEAWVHRLANLVLLTRPKNSQANNSDFAVKKVRYFSTKAGVTNFALTSQVLSEADWGLATLQRRQKALVDKIAEVWRLR